MGAIVIMQQHGYLSGGGSISTFLWILSITYIILAAIFVIAWRSDAKEEKKRKEKSLKYEIEVFIKR